MAVQAENNAEHKALALKAAQESLILLKNENNTLPFKQDVKRITLVGELANQSLLGGYSPAQARGITVYEALKDKFGKNVRIYFIESQIEDSFKSIPNSVLYTEAGGENGVYVEFFNGIDLKGTPAYKSVDPEISHYCII
ncbi:MAG: glycoside hydrolase family 3 C-terminal domain-containing protein [Coprobacter fastidiosus]